MLLRHFHYLPLQLSKQLQLLQQLLSLLPFSRRLPLQPPFPVEVFVPQLLGLPVLGVISQLLRLLLPTFFSLQQQ